MATRAMGFSSTGYAIRGTDYLGNPMNLTQATLSAESILPIGRIASTGIRGVSRIAAKTVGSTPSFIVSKGGTAFPVPKGATGPFPASRGKGIQFIEGVGGNGLSPKVTGFRFMDPVTTGKFQYPGGYGSCFNKAGQTINPITGQTISPLLYPYMNKASKA